ncbi:MAG: hypothetical protein GXP11_04420 [Gammaproteobacteria bacterium]|nr:hypothetical protein [Gammaproteobacteria bacterium]
MAAKAAPRKKPLPVLTPEYLPNLVVFARRYFRSLFSRLKPPHLLVFDNYQDVGEKSVVHEVMRHALAEIPEGINVVIISRHDVPVELARLRANSDLSVIDDPRLRLTVDESRGIINRRSRKVHLTDQTIKYLHELSGGWAAGLTLLMEGGIESGDMRAGPESKKSLFAYFAGEIFDSLDKGTGDFLLKTSLLSMFTLDMAKQLTGNASAGSILSSLLRNNYFISKHHGPRVVYQYHQLFREFLFERVQNDFSKGQMGLLLNRSAELLEQAGQSEEAVYLLEKAGNFEGMARRVLSLAPTLAAQARYGVLSGMLEKIPQKSPWVIYWKGICQLSVNPIQSLDYFENALKGFHSEDQPDGMYLTFVGAFNALIQARMGYDKLDPWIEKLDSLKKEYPSAPAEPIRERVAADIFFVLVLRQPGHPQFNTWKEITRDLATMPGDYGARLSNGWRLCFYYLWIGQYQEAFYLIDSLKSQLGSNTCSDLDLIMLIAADQMASWQAGLWERSFKAASELESISEQSGIPFWENYTKINTALAAITAGDLRIADDTLRKLEQTIGSSDYTDKALYHFAACWSALMKDDLQLAFVHGQAGIEFGYKANTFLTIAMSHFGMAIVDIRSGRPESARVHLEKMREQGLPINNRLIEFMYLLMRAKMVLDAGGSDGEALLRQAFKLGAQNDFVNFYFFMPSMMAGLCIKALELGIETEYVKSLINRRGLVPKNPPLHLANWPWRVEIYTLGRFTVLVDGVPVHPAGKGHNKPLELLKILIALGGREVSEERITEALWPDAEGDMAHSAFTTTLSRLRKLLSGDVLLVSDGRLSLSDRLCRLDTWVFERLLGELDVLLSPGQQDVEKVQRRMQGVFDLYHGPFLAKETPLNWMLGPRERLRLKLLRVIKRLIGFYSRTGHCQQVIALYEKALEQDPLAEEYYRGLMKCHARQGDRAEALAVYGTCRDLFNATFNMAPSEKTEQLCRLIEANDRERLAQLCDACRRS